MVLETAVNMSITAVNMSITAVNMSITAVLYIPIVGGFRNRVKLVFHHGIISLSVVQGFTYRGKIDCNCGNIYAYYFVVTQTISDFDSSLKIFLSILKLLFY